MTPHDARRNAHAVILEYRKWAIKYGESKDVRKANYAFDKLMQLKRRMFEAGPEYVQLVLTLLDDESIHVRYTAAFDTLSIDQERALSVLRELAAGPRSETRIDARDTIAFWEAGTLELPEWKKGWRDDTA